MDRHILQSQTGVRIPPKTVYMVRHGQSLHNAQALACEGVDVNDGRYMDSPLTKLGEQQATNLAPILASIRPQLCITSPLTRATQTCLAATAQIRNVPVVVSPLCTERVAYSCDIGSPVSILKDRFPSLDYSAVHPPHAWWWTKAQPASASMTASLELIRKYPPGAYKEVEPLSHVMQRVNDFRVWLLKRPETSIAVFGHGVFLTNFMDDGKRFSNCEIRKAIM